MFSNLASSSCVSSADVYYQGWKLLGMEVSFLFYETSNNPPYIIIICIRVQYSKYDSFLQSQFVSTNTSAYGISKHWCIEIITYLTNHESPNAWFNRPLPDNQVAPDKRMRLIHSKITENYILLHHNHHQHNNLMKHFVLECHAVQ